MRDVSLPLWSAAWVDGRDPQAKPPLTLMRVALWQGPDRLRRRAWAEHGERVVILSHFRHPTERRWYYYVWRGLRAGWVPGVFLSSKRFEPMGERWEIGRAA